MKWAFIDYENTGSLEGICLPDYNRVFVFCGPHLKKINFGSISNTTFCNVEVLSIKSIGANNLDFHLSFYLGYFHQIADPEIDFHIYSNDNGFRGIVRHLNDIGRNCLKVGTKAAAKSKDTTLIDCSLLIISRLEQLNNNNRPTKKTAFKNFVKSQCKSLKDEADVKEVIDYLTVKKKIEFKNSTVTYNIMTVEKEENKSLSKGATLTLSSLQQLDGRKRPRKKDKLLDWIKSLCESITPAVKPGSVYNELIKEKLITESNQNMSYHIKK